MRTQVVIVGGGPSGLLLGQLLHRRGIDTVVLERRAREHVLARIRAGVLERGTADLMREAGVAGRMEAEGLPHHGVVMAHGHDRLRIDFAAHGCPPVTVYGQTELTRDLYEARDAAGAETVTEAEDVSIEGVDGDAPSVSYRAGGEARHLACDFVVGCDGFHGASRARHPRGRPHPVRARLSLRLARDPVAHAARGGRADLRRLGARLRALLDALRDAEPLLRPVPR